MIESPSFDLPKRRNYRPGQRKGRFLRNRPFSKKTGFLCVQRRCRWRRPNQNPVRPISAKNVLEGSGTTRKLSKVVSTPGVTVFTNVPTPAEPEAKVELGSV